MPGSRPTPAALLLGLAGTAAGVAGARLARRRRAAAGTAAVWGIAVTRSGAPDAAGPGRAGTSPPPAPAGDEPLFPPSTVGVNTHDPHRH